MLGRPSSTHLSPSSFAKGFFHEGRIPAQSAGASTPAGSRIKLPRPIARGAG
jgi:hypothetical protein